MPEKLEVSVRFRGVLPKENTMTFQKQFSELNTLLVPLIGEDNAQAWWTGSNKAFANNSPLTYLMDGNYETIKQYLLVQYNGDYS